MRLRTTAAAFASTGREQWSADPCRGQFQQRTNRPADGCADLLLTDAGGRRLGYDPAAKKNYLEVPGGVYDEGDVLGDDEEDDAKPQKQQENTAVKQSDCVADKSVQVPQPAPGAYVLKIGNNQENAFKLEITSYGPDAKENGHYVLSQPAGSDPSPFYRFGLPPAPGADFEVKAAAK